MRKRYTVKFRRESDGKSVPQVSGTVVNTMRQARDVVSTILTYGFATTASIHRDGDAFQYHISFSPIGGMFEFTSKV